MRRKRFSMHEIPGIHHSSARVRTVSVDNIYTYVLLIAAVCTRTYDKTLARKLFFKSVYDVLPGTTLSLNINTCSILRLHESSPLPLIISYSGIVLFANSYHKYDTPWGVSSSRFIPDLPGVSVCTTACQQTIKHRGSGGRAPNGSRVTKIS